MQGRGGRESVFRDVIKIYWGGGGGDNRVISTIKIPGLDTGSFRL